MDSKRHRLLVKAPSVGAILYQAIALSEELMSFKEGEYPPATYQIRNVLLCIVDFARRELTKILVPTKPYSDERDLEFARTRELAKILHAIYVNIRFLRASSQFHCPLGIQSVISALARRHMPNTPGTEPICLVRAQPVYNAQYYKPVEWLLKPYTDFWDPQGDLGRQRISPEDMLQILWDQWQQHSPEAKLLRVGKIAPRPVSVISFAGLDDHDALLYPILLTHELAHFVAFSQPISLDKKINIRPALDALLKQKSISDNEIDRQEKMINICLRELTADLLAVRMMGFSFFFAQAEFLKTVRSWRRGSLIIRDTGYPENHFRLAVVLAQLLNQNQAWNIRSFFEDAQKTHPVESRLLLSILKEWEHELLDLNSVRSLARIPSSSPSTYQGFNDQVASQILHRILPDFIRHICEIIPDEKCPHLSKSFFQRIERLCERKPPYLPGDSVESFSEIMSAAWAYQLIHGEISEEKLGEPEKMFKEYNQICELVRDAVDKFA